MSKINIDIRNLKKNVGRFRSELPKIIGREAVNFSKERFIAQGWKDNGFERWRKRKGGKRNKGRAVLIDSGRLKRSIRVMNTTSRSITYGSDVPYAGMHNEGFSGTETVKSYTYQRRRSFTSYSGIFNIKTRKERKVTMKKLNGIDVTVKSHSRNMNIPRRRFMGPSIAMNRQITRAIEQRLKTLIK